MPEPPDFDQIARQLAYETGVGRLEEWDPDDPARVISAIAAALRRAWNARGAADIAKVESELYADGTSRDGFSTMLERAIRTLDR